MPSETQTALTQIKSDLRPKVLTVFNDVPNDLGKRRGLHVFGKLYIEVFLNRHEKLDDFQGAQSKVIETGTGRKRWPKPPLG